MSDAEEAREFANYVEARHQWVLSRLALEEERTMSDSDKDAFALRSGLSTQAEREAELATSPPPVGDGGERDVCMRISQVSLERILAENRELRRQNRELQARMTEMAESSLTRQVHDFMSATNQYMRTEPGPGTCPDDQATKLRVELVLEEAFELASALLSSVPSFELSELWINVRATLRQSLVGDEIDWVAVADAFADLDYVIEGSRLSFGLSGVRTKVAAAVHTANMRKLGGPRDPVTGKTLKPEGWVGPEVEIAEILREASVP
jgi:predicted HAD superfamily Cof-like phosphohydrolase